MPPPPSLACALTQAVAVALVVLLAGCTASPPDPAGGDAATPSPPSPGWDQHRWFEAPEDGPDAVAWATVGSSRPAVAAYHAPSGQIRFSPDPAGGVAFEGIAVPEAASRVTPFLAAGRAGEAHVFYEFAGDAVDLPATPVPHGGTGGTWGLRYVRPSAGGWQVEVVADGPLAWGPSPDDPRGAAMQARAAASGADGPVLVALRAADLSTVLFHLRDGSWRTEVLPGVVAQHAVADDAGSLHLCGLRTDRGFGALVHLRGRIGGPWAVDEVAPAAGQVLCRVAIADGIAPHVIYDTDETSTPAAPAQRWVWHAWRADAGWQRERVAGPHRGVLPDVSLAVVGVEDWASLLDVARPVVLCRCAGDWSEEAIPDIGDVPRVAWLLGGLGKPQVLQHGSEVRMWRWDLPGAR